MNKNNKKFIFIGLIFIILIFIVIIKSLNIFSNIKHISFENFNNYISSNEDIIVYYGQENCGACKEFYPILKKVSKNLGLKIYYLDSDKISNQEEIDILESLNIFTTPTVLVKNNNKNYVFSKQEELYNIYNILYNFKFPEKIDRPIGINIISFEDVIEKYKNDFDFILYIGKDDCRDCKKFYPRLEKYINNNQLGIYYFNLNSIKGNNKLYKKIDKIFKISWVPSVYHINNGEIISQYQYLNEEYYKIENKKEQLEIEVKFFTEFCEWFNTQNKIYK